VPWVAGAQPLAVDVRRFVAVRPSKSPRKVLAKIAASRSSSLARSESVLHKIEIVATCCGGAKQDAKVDALLTELTTQIYRLKSNA
jgi:hypothetical protein